MPLVGRPGRTRSDVVSRAREVGLNPSTLYNWLAKYEADPDVTALVRARRSDTGVSKLAPEVLAIVEGVVKETHAEQQGSSIWSIADRVRHECEKKSLPAPHYNTVRAQLNSFRKGVTAPERRPNDDDALYERLREQLPESDFPLRAAQIDHVLLDVIVVGEQHRMSLGRPWLTLAFDLFSRMVLGFYVSLDPPGELSIGQCLVNAILPKEQWLARLSVPGAWPCYGAPEAVLLDDSGELRSPKMFAHEFDRYDMLVYVQDRAGRPHYGGYIDRFVRNLRQLIGDIGPATGSSPGSTHPGRNNQRREEVKSFAKLTLRELDEQLLVRIMAYHAQIHPELGVAPINRFEEGMLHGTSGDRRAGMPASIKDTASQGNLRLDHLLAVERTIQKYGIQIDGICYFHDVLRRWINAPEPFSPSSKRKFIFRRDPRDISTIWFCDPALNAYFAIPASDKSLPAMTLWELRTMKRIMSRKRKQLKAEDVDKTHELIRTIETLKRTFKRLKTPVHRPGSA